jgi:amino acid adenylation domain-containing protein
LQPVITAELGIDDSAITGVFPCTAVQEGMLSQFLQSHGKLYFNHILFKLQPDVDEEKLKSAWNSVFEATEILRSGFVEIDDDLHSFATVTYTSKHIGLPWQNFVGVEDVPSFVEAQKAEAAATALKGLHRPPWQLVFFRTVTRECYILFSGHHALYDANCLSIIFQDVADNYHGAAVPQRPQFAAVLEDIVAHTVDASVVDADREFWSRQLEGSSICRMPNLTPVRITAQTSHVKELRSAWNLSAIEAACKAQGVSLHAAGQAAWVRVLSAYTGEPGLTVGVVFSGRTGLPAAEDVVFPCLVTLPSLCVLVDKSNHQLALDIQSGNAQALKHQHAPLKSIQRWLEHPEESFFDSIFVYQKTEGGSQTTELPWKIVDDDANVDYTLSLEIEPAQDDRLLIRATAKDSHIPAEQTELLIRQFEAALVDILENPQSSATDLSGIPMGLLSVTPAKVAEIPGDVTLLHKFVEKHRQLCPDKVAFEFVTAIEGDEVTKQTWTYAELDDEGNRVANFLRAQGVTTGRIVGISFEKCPEASFAILGVLKAGCAYVAIDYSAPINRKAFILEDSNAFAVLTMDKYVPELQAAVKVPVFSAESEAGIKTASTETPELKDLTPDNLSYCLYTSGTTGTPKGCELTHENAVQAMYAFQRLFAPHWDENSRFLQFASFHFDVSVLEQFWSWSVGVCVTSAPRDLIFQDLAGSIHKMQITHLDLTPSLAALLRPEDVPNLCKGVFITGGEALKQEILDTWRDIGAIYNGYGPTEVTIGMTMYPRVPGNGKPSNIGPQFDNVGTYVFAPGTEKPVPRGALGELCAAGKLVGRGYLNRPELTAKSFPILEKYGEKIYRTGDLVRILYDGTFDFAGRADDQVKLRGQRLEIGEINEVVKKADMSVEAVATLVLKHPKQQKDQLVSFIVVASPELAAGAKEKPVVKTDGEYVQLISKLVAACKSKLPTYMVPTHFLPLSRMPLSVNNKVDNKALKALYQETTLEVLQQLARREEEVGEWTEAEKRVRAVLVGMAGVEVSEVKRSSTVFELGLDSVSVVGLSRRLKKSGFSAASPSLIMQNPAVSQMAIALTAGTTDSEFGRVEAARQQIAAFAIKNSFGITERLGLQPGDVHRILPCTSLQEGMIARFLDSDTPLYFNTFPMVLNADTDVGRLRGAWETVVQATDILRTCFCETPDGYAQVILKRSTIRWEDVQISTEDFQVEAARGLLRAVAQNKTLYAPPVSVTCIKTPTRCVLSLNIFHAVYDGTSLPLILEDVIRAYQGEFSPRPTQFGDVVAHLLSTDLGEAQQFWKANIKPSKSLALDQLRATSAASPLDHAGERKLALDIDQLDALCKQLQCTPQAIFQAAWASVVSEYSSPVVTLGLVVSGRSLPLDDIEGVIGPTFNSIPGSFDVGDAASWESLIKAIHKFNSASLPFHHTPLRLIRKWLRRTSEQQLFDTLFVYQKDAGDGSGPELWNIVPGAAVADVSFLAR